MPLRVRDFSTDPSEIFFGPARQPPSLECVTRTCWAASGVECVTPPEDDRDTLQRFTQPFNQPNKKIATRHLETPNDSTTRENDLSPPLRGYPPAPAVQSLSSKSSVPGSSRAVSSRVPPVLCVGLCLLLSQDVLEGLLVSGNPSLGA